MKKYSLFPPNRHLAISALAGDIFGNRFAACNGISASQPKFAYDDSPRQR